jgi:hypothetical protein
MSGNTLPVLTHPHFPQEHLKALSEAYHILDSVLGPCSQLPAMAPFRFVSHARQHIAAQVDEIVGPIFEEVPRHGRPV